jgi:hypothetical protein
MNGILDVRTIDPLLVLQEIPEFEEESLGTVGFLWSNVSTVHGNPMWRYIDYSNAMDCLRSTHVRFANHLMPTTCL